MPGREIDGAVFKVLYAKTPSKEVDIIASFCSNCLDILITLDDEVGVKRTIWPITSGRTPAPPEVPVNIAEDYNEASLVLPYSAKASAALSRRCLQTVLSDPNAGKSEKWNLSEQIEEVLPKLPSYIAENLDYVREIGNFATHEQKSENTGTILDVEPGEADWNLDVLEALFDFYYIKPKLEQRKREEFDKKIQEAGRRPLNVDSEGTNVQEKNKG